MTDTIEARVARGAALLDEKLPGWVDRIDLDRLDLASDCRCILGQEFADRAGGAFPGPYLAGVYTLGLPGWEAPEHGFDVTCEEEVTDESAEAAYHALTAEWRRVILARRAGVEVSR